MRRDADHQRLYLDALNLSIKKSSDDVATLLQWAGEAGEPAVKLQHVRQAILLLENVASNLDELKDL